MKKTFKTALFGLLLFSAGVSFAKEDKCQIEVLKERIAVLNRVDGKLEDAERMAWRGGRGKNDTIFLYLLKYRKYVNSRVLTYYDELEKRGKK